MKTPHIRDEVDEQFDRMKWLRQARKAAAIGIADLAPPPGGWPGAAPATPKHETPPVRVRAGAPPVRYGAPELPPELAHPDMAPFRLPAARAAAKPAVTESAKSAAARVSAIPVAARRGRRNAVKAVARILNDM